MPLRRHSLPGDPTVGVKAGGGDDAIHLRRSRWSRKTLCDQRAKDRNVKIAGHFWPDGWEGCWTCLQQVGLEAPESEGTDA